MSYPNPLRASNGSLWIAGKKPFPSGKSSAHFRRITQIVSFPEPLSFVSQRDPRISMNLRRNSSNLPPKAAKFQFRNPTSSISNSAICPLPRTMAPCKLAPLREAKELRRGSQVVRPRSAKPLFAGSIPAPASLALGIPIPYACFTIPGFSQC